MWAWRISLLLCALSVTAFALGTAMVPPLTLVDFVSTILRGVTFLTFVLVGAVIIRRHSRHSVGWLFCFAGVMHLLSWLGEAYVERKQFVGMSDLPADELLVWMATWPEIVGFGAAPLLVIFLFPSGKHLSKGWGQVALATMFVTVIGALGFAFKPGPMADFPYVDNPYGIGGVAGQILDVMNDLAWPLLIPSMVAAASSSVIRFRRARGVERQQIKWLAYAGMLLGAFIPFWGLMVLVGFPDLPEHIAGFVLITMPIAAGIAILRYRLYDIDVIINRTLVYGLLTAALLSSYLVIVVALSRILDPVTRDSDVAVAASTLAVAALFGPLRRRIQQFIDRRFYRSRYDATEALARFGTRLRDEVDLEVVRGDILGLVGTTVQPTHASLWLNGGTNE